MVCYASSRYGLLTNWIDIAIKEQLPGRFDDALRDYFSLILPGGLPYVKMNSDYGSVEKALPEGKALKSYFWGLMIDGRRRIVDLG